MYSLQNFSRQFKEESAKARITLKAIESLTYTCTDPQLLKDLNIELERTFTTFRSSLPEAEGLVILPAVRKRVKASTTSKPIPSLPPYKKHGRKRLNSLYRNRVGRRASKLRKVYNLSYTHVCNMHNYNTGSKGVPHTQKEGS